MHLSDLALLLKQHPEVLAVISVAMVICASLRNIVKSLGDVAIHFLKVAERVLREYQKLVAQARRGQEKALSVPPVRRRSRVRAKGRAPRRQHSPKRNSYARVCRPKSRKKNTER
jgi:hypothetical protein